jgi:hypothetical protein
MPRASRLLPTYGAFIIRAFCEGYSSSNIQQPRMLQPRRVDV